MRIMKRIVKLCFSCILCVIDYCVKLCATSFGFRRVRGIILYYHGITDQQKERFVRQMDYLKKKATLSKLPIHNEINSRRSFVSISFDDGYSNILRNAIPELEKRGIPATIFVSTGSLGIHPTWLHETKNAERFERLMNEEELLALNPELFAFGSHTVNHPSLDVLDYEQAKEELLGSKKKLESILKREIILFSFPHGRYNSELLSLCKKIGYKQVYSIQPLLHNPEEPKFIEGRVAVEPDDWMIEFRLKTAGSYRWMHLFTIMKRTILQVLVSDKN